LYVLPHFMQSFLPLILNLFPYGFFTFDWQFFLYAQNNLPLFFLACLTT